MANINIGELVSALRGIEGLGFEIVQLDDIQAEVLPFDCTSCIGACCMAGTIMPLSPDELRVMENGSTKLIELVSPEMADYIRYEDGRSVPPYKLSLLEFAETSRRGQGVYV
jgi:hypothetical protein